MSGSNLTIACPACGHENVLRGRAMTVALTCKACGKYFSVGKWNKNVHTFDHKETPAIAIGAKGKIEGFLYEVVGFAVKRENKYRYKWREYLLFNPFRGYAFLSEYDGHWNFVWPLEHAPRQTSATDDFHYEGNHFRLYQKYTAEVIFAEGEFFFDVVEMTEATTNYEFISPPFVLALETSEDSLLWCKGEYFRPDEVSTIFSTPKEKLPSRTGIGYTQPLSGKFSRAALITTTLILIAIAIVSQFIMSSLAEEKVVFHGSYSKDDLNDQKMFVTPSFQLSEGKSSVEFYIEAPLSNDWFYGEFALVNEDNGTEYNFSKDLEFYHGYEDGSSWSEGSKVGEAYLSQIPGGNYHVNIYPEFSLSNNNFLIIVTRDVKSTANLFFTCIALVVFPAGYLVWQHYREVKRWSESDYSPYDS